MRKLDPHFTRKRRLRTCAKYEDSDWRRIRSEALHVNAGASAWWVKGVSKSCEGFQSLKEVAFRTCTDQSDSLGLQPSAFLLF